MKQLIKITEENGEKLVNARELHEFLGSKQRFTDWIKNRIKQYGFVENEDFVLLHKIMKQKTGSGGHNRLEYGLTIDMAKELSMLENNDKGRQARRYFILKEKEALQQKELASPAKVASVGGLDIAVTPVKQYRWVTTIKDIAACINKNEGYVRRVFKNGCNEFWLKYGVHYYQEKAGSITKLIITRDGLIALAPKLNGGYAAQLQEWAYNQMHVDPPVSNVVVSDQTAMYELLSLDSKAARVVLYNKLINGGLSLR